MRNKIDNMIGFAVRSNNVTIGYKITKEGIKNRRVFLVIVAKDSSENIRKKLDKLIENKNLYYIEYKDKNHLGSVIGKREVSFIGIKDKNMVKYIIDLLNQEVSYEDIRIIKDIKCTK